MQSPKLSIIIVNYNNPDLLGACLKSIDKYLIHVQKEVIVVDNASYVQFIAKHQTCYPYVKPIYLHENMGFGYANNIAVKNCTGEILLLLNSDTEFVDESFVDTLEKYSAVDIPELWGLRLIWPDGKFQQSYTRRIGFFDFLATYTSICPLLRKLSTARAHKYYEIEFSERTKVDVIYGTAVLIRKTDYEKLGGFLKRYFMYFEDVDLSDRFTNILGGRVVFDPSTTLIHRVKGSSKSQMFNFNFTKSKYLYGAKKFGFIPMALIFPLDLSFTVLDRLIKNAARLLSKKL